MPRRLPGLFFLLGFVLAAALGARAEDAALPEGKCSARSPVCVLDINVESAWTCDLTVVTGPRTVADRGRVRATEHLDVVRGSFRYWEEPAGRTLYVYDEVGDLVTRVVRPVAVVFRGFTSPE